MVHRVMRAIWFGSYVGAGRIAMRWIAGRGDQRTLMRSGRHVGCGIVRALGLCGSYVGAGRIAMRQVAG